MNRVFMGTAAVALLVFAQPANAVLVTDGNPTSITYNVSQPVTGTNLKANIVFSNFDFTTVGSNTQVTFNTSVKNTTTIGTLTQAQLDSVRLTGFAYDTDPNATGATDNSSIYNSLISTNFPSFQTVDVCLIAAPQDNNCSGGNNGGLSPGGTDTFTETLTFSGAITSFDFGIGQNEQLATKFQTDFGSFETGTNPCLVNCDGFPPPPPPPPPPGTVPEPGSILMLMSGLIGLGGWFGIGRAKPTKVA